MGKRWVGLLTGASALAIACGASAQTAPTGPAALAAPNSVPDAQASVTEVVVTAQRREEKLQNVPIAISAFSQADLQRGDVTNIARLARFTPGFNFGQSGLDTRPAIRGVRTDTVDGNGDTSVGFYIDDVYQSLAVQASHPFVDVQRVEVARGPQGTLFGRNTFGGAISVVDALPTKDFDFGGEATAGNYSRFAGQGFINLPISDTFGLRFAGFKESRDGYIKNVDLPGNDLGDKDTNYARITARWQPTPALDVVGRLTYWTEGGTGFSAYGYKEGGILVNPTTGAADLHGTPVFGIDASPKDGKPDINGIDVGTQTSTDPYTWQGQFIPRTRLREWAGSLQVKWSNDEIFLRSISGYQTFKYRANSGTAVGPSVDTYLQDRDTETFTQELQIGGVRTTPLQWIAGVYYFRDRYTDSFSISDPDYYFAGPNLEATDSYAAYAQASYALTDKLKLTGGVRYTRDEKSLDSQEFFYFFTDGPSPPTTFSGSKDFSRTTWRAGADYQLTPDNLLYASFSTGFRSGGFNAGAIDNPAIPPTFNIESVNAYEIGSKNRFLEGKLQVNASFYYNDFSNLQIQSQFELPGTATVISAVQNAGAAHAYGLELEAIYKPVRELTLNATANLVEAKFDDYSFVGRPSRFYATALQDLSGNEIPHTPKQKYTFGARYDFIVPGVGVITPSASLLVSSRYYNTDYNTALDLQPAYATADLSLGWRSSDDKYGVEAFVTNVSNEAVLNYAAFGSITLLTNYEQPRFYGVRFSFRK